MTIKELLKDKLKKLLDREREIKSELTNLHNIRNKGQEVDTIKFKELHSEWDIIKKRIKDLKRIIK